MIALVLAASMLAGAQKNVISNGDFEMVSSGVPQGWAQNTWGGKADFVLDSPGREGGHCVLVSSSTGADAGWSTVVAVKPYSKYLLTAWIKTDGVKPIDGLGALINLHARPEHTVALGGSNDWTRVSMEIATGADDALQVNCLLGYFGRAIGRAWYDDVELKLVSTTRLDPSVHIDFESPGAAISPYIYGQFIEHLGRCINGGIWAEMLEDRKFFFSVGDKDSPWKASSPSEVTLDPDHAIVNGHSVKLNQDASVSQDGLWLNKGRSYVGHIWLSSADRNGRGEVSIQWGPRAGDSEKVEIDGLKSTFKKYPFRFTPKASSKAGKLTIRSVDGDLRVGCVSLMPSDNYNGMRRDILALLKELDAPIYRWPGGNFVSGYDWKDGIGDRDLRPTRKNPAWKGIEPNDFGTDEFMTLCKEIHTEPLIVVNTGLGDSKSAVEWIEYVNGKSSTPQGANRANNGHAEPYGVKWWGVGNEMFGNWQLGHVSIDQYVVRHNEFANAMRSKDPNIKLIGSGDVGSNGWSRKLLEDCFDSMDLISEHFYCQERPGVMAHVAQMPNAVDGKVKAHREYRRELPQLKGKDIRIALDEWNYWYGAEVFGELGTRYFLKDALGIAAGLHEMFRNSDIIEMANYAQTVNVIGAIKATPTDASMETTGLVLQLYRRQFGSIPLKLSGTPAPLDVVAATTADGSNLTIAVVNPTADPQTLKLQFSQKVKFKPGMMWIIANPNPNAFNDPGHSARVSIVQKSAAASKRLALAPYSISLYRWPIEDR